MDRVGLGWRPELAAAILTNLHHIDVVEVIADDYFHKPARQVRALRTLSAQVPVLLHGVTQGLASTAPADRRRLDRLARVINLVEPESWSEHLAFVRGGGHEIGHLAAPPRNRNTIDGACRNLEQARRIVGAIPMMENIATLIHPPGSDRDETTWLRAIIDHSGCGLLLDLHNLHANAANFGYDPIAALDQLPCHRVTTVHIAGGRRTRHGRLLDDHLHETPDEVYALLTALAARVDHPLTVILERDGRYPRMESLLNELAAARNALTEGRAKAAA
jgi:uncharacterized protein (UPF0276 family)